MQPTDGTAPASPGPLVVAALSWADPRAVVDPLSAEVTADARAGASAADRCALEHALRLAPLLGGRCVAVTVGPADADLLLRDALAAGADEVLRVDAPVVRDPADDGDTTAAALLTGLARVYGRAPDLVVCGDHSAGRGTGATPAFLAARIGAAQALGLLGVSACDGVVRALRRLDGGRRERLTVPLPAVCSVEPTLALRRGPLASVLRAQRAEVPVVPWEEAAGSARPGVRAGAARPYRPRARLLAAPPGPDARARLRELTGADVRPAARRVVFPDTPAEAADLLIRHLVERGYLEGPPGPGDGESF
ncbi:hypothetical protein GCM10010377_72780 [Streptomyces viridiviolaceus]|uniref:Mycofactocin-associated electron transfer flavoprotein beta subunit n=1 Tax=Streptomyces viridiviolaceus TaxID=68282 RepID=A0ABW2DWZ0_9ACTN|nr:mycofactocin-associated electron transfer flavoprotein beta subunit [Streptomyces viridiviolaceus]GHB71603.1 hypothetical protein GCM10010377_72780 [Streptomyces viridiviolaceus]